jgi:hypothetical protein
MVLAPLEIFASRRYAETGTEARGENAEIQAN